MGVPLTHAQADARWPVPGGERLAVAAARLRRCAGLTMIEVVVVMSIVGLTLAFGMPNLASWISSYRIRNAAESIENGIQLARSEAVRRNTNVQFILTSIGSSKSDWSVTCVTPQGDGDGDGQADCPGTGMVPPAIMAYSSKEGSKFASVAAGQSTIVFNGSGRITPTPSSAINITVTNPTAGTCVAAGGSMRCLRVDISQSGQIRVCDPALATTDPRGC